MSANRFVRGASKQAAVGSGLELVVKIEGLPPGSRELYCVHQGSI